MPELFSIPFSKIVRMSKNVASIHRRIMRYLAPTWYLAIDMYVCDYTSDIQIILGCATGITVRVGCTQAPGISQLLALKLQITNHISYATQDSRTWFQDYLRGYTFVFVFFCSECGSRSLARVAPLSLCSRPVSNLRCVSTHNGVVRCAAAPKTQIT